MNSLLFACFCELKMVISVVFYFWSVPGRVRVAVRLRPRNAEELVADADFADCVELQPEVFSTALPLPFLFLHVNFQNCNSMLCIEIS